MGNENKIAVFGGGCFWCTEAIYQNLRGVSSVLPGYAGGTTPNPRYEQVCGGRTGHAEVIEIKYNPAEITYQDLLTVFFATHDPTTVNQQGNDVGTQYRSVIFYTEVEQKEEAENFIKELNYPANRPIVTEVVPLEKFYVAEDYHQKYFERNSDAPYCQVVIDPKVQKLREKFVHLLK